MKVNNIKEIAVINDKKIPLTNVNNVGGSIANVNTVASNLSGVNSFADRYRVDSSAPGTNNDAGDLYFDTSSNELRVYNGSAWQGGVTATGNLAGTGANTFTGNQTIQNALPSIDLIDSDNNSDFKIQNANGTFLIYDTTNSASRFTIASDGTVDVNANIDANQGIDVTGNITVSGTVDGRDVAADGSKLDGIESGATADQTGAEIASALNGQHIHTTAQIGYDSNDHFQFTNNTQLDLYINGNNEFRFEADGDFHADGDVTAFSTTIASDSRLKSDIHTINNALGIVGKLRGVSYKWLRDGRSDIGVIAQEVEEVIPEIVKTKTTLGLDGQEEMKTVDYGKIVGVLINAINELKEEVEELKNAKITG